MTPDFKKKTAVLELEQQSKVDLQDNLRLYSELNNVECTQVFKLASMGDDSIEDLAEEVISYCHQTGESLMVCTEKKIVKLSVLRLLETVINSGVELSLPRGIEITKEAIQSSIDHNFRNREKISIATREGLAKKKMMGSTLGHPDFLSFRNTDNSAANTARRKKAIEVASAIWTKADELTGSDRVSYAAMAKALSKMPEMDEYKPISAMKVYRSHQRVKKQEAK